MDIANDQPGCSYDMLLGLSSDSNNVNAFLQCGKF